MKPGDRHTAKNTTHLEILRVLHNDEVTDTADVTEQFAETVNARRRAHRQGDPIPASYPVGPISWLANAYCDAAKLSEVGAVVMAMVYSGTGHRRALAEASDRLAQAARGQADDEDMSSVVAKLLPLVERYRAVAG